MSELDKFTYSTTYGQDYGRGLVRSESSKEPEKVECKAKAYQGEAVGRSYENPLNTCPCRSGGSMPARGAVKSGLPSNLDKPCSCSGGGTSAREANKEDLAEMMYKAAETGYVKPVCGEARNKAELTHGWTGNVKSVCGTAHNKGELTHGKTQQVQSPRQESFRPVPIGHFGGQFEGPLNREHTKPKHNDQALPFSFDKPCVCPPGKPESGPQNYGPAWIRERAKGEIEPRLTGGQPVPPEMAQMINPGPPAARVSCAPESDMSKYDQPNTFMKKLYEKYPYLYQILRDTPPEELIARVFRDRFLSTYQVDYLHMGTGKENSQRGGEQIDQKFVSPEGEEEPNTIPGCTYRSTKRGNFAKKKSELKTREIEENEEEPVVKEEPRVSEYMASISKLGGDIITEQLYKIEAKNRKAAAGKNVA